jgi:hypothetical protein
MFLTGNCGWLLILFAKDLVHDHLRTLAFVLILLNGADATLCDLLYRLNFR